MNENERQNSIRDPVSTKKKERKKVGKSQAHLSIIKESILLRCSLPLFILYISRSFRSLCLKNRCTQCFRTGVVFHGITVVLLYFYGAWWSWMSHKTTKSQALSLSFSSLPLSFSCDSSSRKDASFDSLHPRYINQHVHARVSTLRRWTARETRANCREKYFPQYRLFFLRF